MYQGGRRKRSNDYLRSCDYCGRLVLRSTMVKKDNYLACKDDARGRERVTLDKANAANVVPRRWKPAKSRLSDRDNEIDAYQDDEAVAFNALAVDGWIGADGVFRQGAAPYEYIDYSGPGHGQPTPIPTGLTETARCAGWTIDYLYKVLVENKRPASWLANATRKITELGTWLLANQFGGSATATVYGGFPRDGQAGSTATIWAEDQGVALLGLVRAFQVSGNMSYMLGARRAATCLRRLQCGGLRTTGYLSGDLSGGIFQVGPFPTNMVATSPFTTTTAVSTDFYAGDLCACEGLDALRTVDGDSTYGDATAVGEFASPTAATLSTMISQARNWWGAGAKDLNNVIVVGLSATTPFEFYRVGTSTLPIQPFWNYKWSTFTNGYVTSLNIAKALRAIFILEGLTSQVTSVNAWLRALPNDQTFVVPSEYGIWQDRTTLGKLDTTFAPPAEIAVPLSGGAAMAGAYYYMTTGGGQDVNGNWLSGPAYDLAAAGLLSPIQSASLKPFKNGAAPLITRNWLRREHIAP
jgi:hypothetical protein